MTISSPSAAAKEVDLAGRVARRHLGQQLPRHEVHPDARRLDIGWLADHGHLWVDSTEVEIVLTVDLGGHDMVAKIDVPPDRGWDGQNVILVAEDGTLIVRVEGGPDLEWDLAQVLWRPV